MAKAKSKGGQTVVDFSGVETGGRIRVPEDDYRLRVKSVKHDTAKSSGNPMLVWEFEIVDGGHEGKVLRDRTVLQDNSLWKLKQILEAMGVSVPSKRVALDLKRYIGMELAGTTVDDEFENKMGSKIADYFTVDVLDAADEEDEKPKKSKKDKSGKKSKKSKKAADEEEIEDLNLDEI